MPTATGTLLPATTEELLEGLNEHQREAVEHGSGPLLILAGPGSGKTRVIVHRIAWLVRTGVVAADGVLGITFTNKAANEMRERLGKLLGNRGPTAALSTYHSFCSRILRADGHHVGVASSFVVYDADDQIKAVRAALDELNLDKDAVAPRSVLWNIGQWKMRMLTPEQVAMDNEARGDGYRNKQFIQVYAQYEKILRRASALDFDDLLLQAVKLLKDHRTVRDKYTERYQYVLVDEYQDTNHAQYDLTLLLGRDHRNVCAVGDPDQAIYGWRGADIGNIHTFEEDFPERTVVNLERNYRSSGNIVRSAAALIARNRERMDKTLWTGRATGAELRHQRCDTDQHEAYAIAGIVASEPASARQTAVLYRTNGQSRLIEDALRRAEIPYHIVGNIRFYERREIKDGLAYLKVVVNPHDDVSLRRIINSPPRGIGKRSIEKASGSTPAKSRDRTLFDADPATASNQDADRPSLWTRLREGCEERRLTGAALERMESFIHLIEKIRATAGNRGIGRTVEHTIGYTGYLTALKNENTPEAEDRLDNLMELVAAAEDYEETAEDPSLADFINRQSLLSEVDEGDGPSDARVWMMTLHAAKGLEFPTVVIAGVEEYLLPHKRSMDSVSGIEEERRLFYVGMTRAMDQLVMTTAVFRRRSGGNVNPESRFLDEIEMT